MGKIEIHDIPLTILFIDDVEFLVTALADHGEDGVGLVSCDS